MAVADAPIREPALADNRLDTAEHTRVDADITATARAALNYVRVMPYRILHSTQADWEKRVSSLHYATRERR